MRQAWFPIQAARLWCRSSRSAPPNKTPVHEEAAGTIRIDSSARPHPLLPTPRATVPDVRAP